MSQDTFNLVSLVTWLEVISSIFKHFYQEPLKPEPKSAYFSPPFFVHPNPRDFISSVLPLPYSLKNKNNIQSSSSDRILLI